MKGFGFILCLLALLACSDKQGTPTGTTSPNNGITRSFEIALTPGDCPNSPCLNSTTADTYCVSVGFEYSTDSRCFERTQNYQTQLYCRVTCYKQ